MGASEAQSAAARPLKRICAREDGPERGAAARGSKGVRRSGRSGRRSSPRRSGRLDGRARAGHGPRGGGDAGPGRGAPRIAEARAPRWSGRRPRRWRQASERDPRGGDRRGAYRLGALGARRRRSGRRAGGQARQADHGDCRRAVLRPLPDRAAALGPAAAARRWPAPRWSARDEANLRAIESVGRRDAVALRAPDSLRLEGLDGVGREVARRTLARLGRQPGKRARSGGGGAGRAGHLARRSTPS